MNGADVRWYHIPVVWLGIGILFATLAGCISMIFVASRYPDHPLPVEPSLLKMPENRPTDPRR